MEKLKKLIKKMKGLKQYIFEQYSKVRKANKLQQQNGGFMPNDYTVEFLEQLMEYGDSSDEMFEDENGDFVRLDDILEQIEDDKCKMQVHFDINPMDDDLMVEFYLNNKLWCSGFVGAWNWDRNESEEQY